MDLIALNRKNLPQNPYILILIFSFQINVISRYIVSRAVKKEGNVEGDGKEEELYKVELP